MKLKKRTFFQIHSWIGIKLSILFFIVCFSGTIATLSNELDWLFTPGMRAVPQDTLASRNLIMENLRKQYPDASVPYWVKNEAPYLCDLVYVERDGRRTYVFANPYTGQIQGEAQITVQRYFRDLHYYLFIPFQIGHFTVLLFGFMLLASLVTALVFYKKWYKKLFRLTVGKGPLVFFRSFHRLVGLWSIPFALLFSITGIWYFIERANVGNVTEQIHLEFPVVDSSYYKQTDIENFTYRLDYDRAIQIAQEQIPNLKVETIGVPVRQGQPLYLYGESHVPLVRSRANRVYLNPFNYEVLKVQRAEEINTLTWINDIADPLHFGYWGGLPAKIVWFIMGLGISSLVLSGIWIALKRKVRKKRAGTPEVMGYWKYVNYLVTGGMFFLMFYFLIARYGVDWTVLTVVGLGWGVLIGLAYYVYRVRVAE